MTRQRLSALFALFLLLAGCAAPGQIAVPPLPPTPPGFTSTPSSTLDPRELAFPIRAAFYYPWFPQSWNQAGMNPFSHYHPGLGFYSQDYPAVIRAQVQAMQYGGIQLGIASWWGQGHYTDLRVPALLKAGEESGFHWALYYELESMGNPTVETLRADLAYIRGHYASSPAYLHIGGRFVVFVYADTNDNCEMSARWKQANNGQAYVVLKVFSGYRACPDQPEAWHQYAPDLAQKQVGSDSFSISPGFWKAGEDTPRLVRDLEAWNASIRAMLESGANFQLVTSFNEWGEGTAVESAAEWASPSGYGLFLDALHENGLEPDSAPVTNTPPAKPPFAPTIEVPPPIN